MSRYVPLVHVLMGAALAIALLPMPYGYYQLLRFAVCATFAALAFDARAQGRPGHHWVALATFAVLYNPIATISFTREIWGVLNVVTIGALTVDLWARRRALRHVSRDRSHHASGGTL